MKDRDRGPVAVGGLGVVGLQVVADVVVQSWGHAKTPGAGGAVSLPLAGGARCAVRVRAAGPEARGIVPGRRAASTQTGGITS